MLLFYRQIMKPYAGVHNRTMHCIEQACNCLSMIAFSLSYSPGEVFEIINNIKIPV